jgi:hypothetical protein
MSAEELFAMQKEREESWLKARRARLDQQAVELDARIKRIEKQEKAR